ncbi:helix-turn-helix domain-containing protein [Neotabrizicola sp. VNH66]|uniref:helix-turn-helix domain-containing protein n=1 Tax=Neotabrizicola sp. VNH66 TaxID=3400918 RepID=UPI003BFAFA6B
MSAIFESTTLGPTERLIMLALADHADDEGRCYPSIQRLSQRTGLSERAVQINTRKLVEQGYIRVVAGGGKGNANLYFVSANPACGAPFEAPNPAPDAPRTKCTPASDSPQTPHDVRPNPAPDAPEPSGTTIGTVTEAADGRTHAREADQSEDLIWTILHALGFDRGQTIPRYWMGADAPLIVARWRTDLGLTEAEICEVARQNSIQFGAPAQGPKILTRHMQAFAAAKSAPPLTPDQITIRPHQNGPHHDRHSERRSFDQTINAVADGLSAGTIHLDTASRDPFARRG